MFNTTNRKLGSVILVFSILFLVMSYQLPSSQFATVDADAIPKALGWILLGLSIILFIQKDRETEEQRQRRQIPKKEIGVLLIVALLIFLYISLLEILGFVIVTMLFIFVCSKFLGYDSLKSNIVVSILFPVIMYGIFVYLLQISLPKGILPI
ncbi:tripartite tricarboxylate transporter TctB family protein [Alkalihalobacillus deserti]|uniref:tripartite tricarboxylate transporter TctB family protein n=1 Tax=Alkalihalobacillus deserti TaxID=2879466 RepID=UPI001D14DB87|nr:tripartite tricarboxylate transporter TctB family protein [Alkalihalobacillus deserti]